MVKNGNFTLEMTSSGQESQFHIATDMQWSQIKVIYSYWTSGQQWQFLMATDMMWSRMAILQWQWNWVVKNVNFTLLLISRDQESQFTYAMSCNGQEWQFFIGNDI